MGEMHALMYLKDTQFDRYVLETEKITPGHFFINTIFTNNVKMSVASVLR